MMRLGIFITTWKIEEVPVRQDMGHVLCRLQSCDIVVVRLQRSQPSRDQRLCMRPICCYCIPEHAINLLLDYLCYAMYLETVKTDFKVPLILILQC